MDQIYEWEAYDKLDPIGLWREDFRMAFLSAIVTNLAISVHGKKGASYKNVLDFLPEWDPTEEVEEVKMQSVEEMKSILLGLAQMNKGRIAIDNTKPPKTIANKMKL